MTHPSSWVAVGQERGPLSTPCRSPELVPLEKEFGKETEGGEASRCLLREKRGKAGEEEDQAGSGGGGEVGREEDRDRKRAAGALAVI